MSQRLSDFQTYVAQTNNHPLLLEVVEADGVYLTTKEGKKYLDFTAGIAVNNLGFKPQAVVNALKQQADRHLHTMVYGEYVESPQVELSKLLVEQLPNTLNNVLFTSSGAEAVEAALKLARRFTGREEMIAFNNAYHGSTLGALSVTGHHSLKEGFGQLLPGVRFLHFNNAQSVNQITNQTACVLVEPIQAASGVTVSQISWLKKLRKKCDETGALLIFDEIQTGYGRTGSLFAFEQAKVVPDVLLLAKAFGGGLPVGAVVSEKRKMNVLANQPEFGHINTFGGNAMACAAGLATLKVLLETPEIIQSVKEKGQLISSLVGNYPAIEKITGKGLMLGVHFASASYTKKVVEKALQQGLILIGFLFEPKAVRISPPLTITEKEIRLGCNIIKRVLEECF